MKNEATKSKFRSTPNFFGQLFSQLIWCLGALTLCCSRASAQNLFATGFDGSSGNSAIFEFTHHGVQSTFASGLSSPEALAFDNAGNLFVADFNTTSIYKFSPDGVRTTFVSGIIGGLAFDRMGNLFVGYSNNPLGGGGVIYKFAPDGTRTTFASGLDFPGRIAFDKMDNLFVFDITRTPDANVPNIFKFTPDGVRTTFVSGEAYNSTSGLAFDSAGNLFVSEYGDGVKNGGVGPDPAIYKFTPAGVRSVFAGAGELNAPIAIAFDGAGNLFVSDDTVTDSTEEKVFPGATYKFSPNGARSTFAPLVLFSMAFQPTQTTPTPTPTTTPSVTVSVSANKINQGTYATFTISASTMNPSQVTKVHYMMNGKARAGVNYTLSGVFGEADIPAGVSSTTVTLQALNAPMRGKSATATMTIMSGPDYTLSNPKKANVTIVN